MRSLSEVNGLLQTMNGRGVQFVEAEIRAIEAQLDDWGRHREEDERRVLRADIRMSAWLAGYVLATLELPASRAEELRTRLKTVLERARLLFAAEGANADLGTRPPHRAAEGNASKAIHVKVGDDRFFGGGN